MHTHPHTGPRRLAFASIVGVCLGLPSVCPADVITVDNDLVELPTADFTDIQSAINASADGDEIVVYPGVYAGALDMSNRLITLRSTDPDDPAVVGATRIRPNGNNAYVIRCNGSETSETVIDGFRFNTNADNAPIYITSGAGATVRRCVFDDYSGGNFLAIHLVNASGVVIDRCTFRNVRTGLNSSSVIRIESSAGVEVTGCTLDRCKGNPVTISQSTSVSFERCEFLDNAPNTVTSGGAVSLSNGPFDVSFSDCLFQGNLSSRHSNALYRGGAIYASFAGGPGRSVAVARCVFNANEVNAAADDDAFGGAIYTANTDLVVTDSVFVGNEAISDIGDDAWGGAIAFSHGNLDVAGCTFHANRATSPGIQANAQGGAIHFGSSNPRTPTDANCIFRSNTISDGSNNTVSHTFGAHLDHSNLTSGNPRYVSDPSNGGDGWGDNPLTGSVDEGANDNYGDLRLRPNSPAVGAGSNARALSSTDIDGRPRIIGVVTDQGAYESGYSDTGAYYVDQSATGSGAGNSWANAATDISSLLALPVAGEVLIAEGVYPVGGGVALHDDVQLLGGYRAGGAIRDPNEFVTVLSGDVLGDDEPGGVNRSDNAPVVVSAIGAANVSIDGLTISGGFAPDAGGGVRLESCTDVLLNDVIIEDNDSADRAAGLLADATTLTITGSAFRDNRSARVGAMRLIGASVATVEETEFVANQSAAAVGAVTVAEASLADFRSCLFEDNQAGADVGALLIGNDDTIGLVDRCVFRGNSAGALAGALRFSGGGSGSITNSLFHDNTSGSGGGTVRLQNHGTLDVVNSTIVHNDAPSGTVSGVAQANTGMLSVVNSIVWGNTGASASSAQEAQVRGNMSVDHSLVEGWDGSIPGTGTIDGDPGFVNAAGDNYRLAAGSVAIDAGDSDRAPGETDLAGAPRVADDTGTPDTGVGPAPIVDMGAYEFQGTTPPAECNDADLAAPYGELDFSDVIAFLSAFSTSDPAADLAAPQGQWDFSDVLAFLTAFAAGCP